MFFTCKNLPKYSNPPCEDAPSYNKVVMVAIILPNATITDYSNNTQWNTDIQSGAIRIVKKTRGTYDGGVPTYGEGFGNVLEKVTGVKHTMNFFTKYRKANHYFFNGLNGLQAKGLAIVSGENDTLQVVNRGAMFFAKAPITNDLSKEREYETTVTWSGVEMPIPYAVPASFLIVLDEPIADSATGETNNGFIANWQAVSNAVGYIIQISTLSDFSVILQENELGNVLSYGATGLSANTAYFYRVIAYSFNDESKPSNVISVITLP